MGDERQPNAPTWESGVHTHGDGIIHIHPFQSFEEARGASLAKWFEYGGGVLTATSFREPGVSSTFSNGNAVPGEDGAQGQVYIFESRATGDCNSLDLTGQWIRIPPDYVPQDGDCIRVAFESEENMRAHIENPPSLPEYNSSTSNFGAVTPQPVSVEPLR